MTQLHLPLVGVRRHGVVAAALTACRPQFTRALAFSLGVNLLILTPTIYMLQLYERVLFSFNLLTLVAVSFMAFVLLAGMGLADRQRARWLSGAGMALEQQLAGRLFQAGYGQALSGVDNTGAARLRDAAQVRQFVGGPGFAGLLELPWSLLYVGVTWLLHPWLGMAVLVFVVLQALLAWKGHGLSVVRIEAAQAAARLESAFTQWKFRHAEVVAGLGMTPGLQARWQQRHADALASATQAQAQGNRLTALSKSLRYVQQSLALGLGAWLAVRGELSVGAMIAGTVLTTRALAPVDAVVSVWKDLIAARTALRRIDDALATNPTEPPLQTGQRPLDIQPVPVGAPLHLDDVAAWDPSGQRAVLEHISLTLQPGQVVAVVGPSGAGKSSLAKLVAGIWPVATGVMRSPVGQAAIGYLPQDVELFDGTVAENIARLGMPRPDAVLAAAQRAGLHDTILRLPKGYDTVLGQGGHPLSGGLRQRVALARAIYGEPRLVVLDEPNAHLDQAGEHALSVLLQGLKDAGCTVLVVTHRQALLKAVDRILYLEQGQLVADRFPRASAPSNASPHTPC